MKLNNKKNRVVFDAIPEDETPLTESGFNTLMGLTILWGLMCNFAFCVFLNAQVTNLFLSHPVAVIIGYFILVFAGAFIVTGTENPIIAFIGYNLICLPIGVILTPFVNQYTSVSIAYICLLTGIIVAIMTILSSIFPDEFLSLGRFLLTTLILIIVIEGCLILFVGYEGHIIDYLVVALFSLYIGFDWQKSQICAATPYDAIACATDIYLDIINIFIRLLEIFGKKKN